MVAQGCMWGLFAATPCTDRSASHYSGCTALCVGNSAKRAGFRLVSVAPPASLGVILGIIGHNSDFNQ